MISLDTLPQSILNGLSMGVIYVLIALGLTLLYSVMHILNFTHGDIYVLGGFGVYLLVTKTGLDYFLAIPIVMALLFLAGMGFERVLFRPVQGKFINCLLVTMGASLILQSLGWMILGKMDVSVPSPISGAVRFGDLALSWQRLTAMAVGIVLVACLYLVVTKTKIGRQMRAIEQDAEAASLFGINTNNVNRMALGIGFALAGLAGALVGSLFYLNPGIGLLPMLKAFVIIILGGLGSIPGTVIGGLILGTLDSVIATTFGANIAYPAIFGVLIAVLILKPKGIAGHD